MIKLKGNKGLGKTALYIKNHQEYVSKGIRHGWLTKEEYAAVKKTVRKMCIVCLKNQAFYSSFSKSTPREDKLCDQCKKLEGFNGT